MNESKIIGIEQNELLDIISQVVRMELAEVEGKFQTGDDLGKTGGVKFAVEMTGLTRGHIHSLSRKRHTKDGIPCVKGRNDQLVFSSVAINLWQLGKPCNELTAWMEEKLKKPL